MEGPYSKQAYSNPRKLVTIAKVIAEGHNVRPMATL